MNKDNIVIGLSGGIESLVAARQLLFEDKYNVIPVMAHYGIDDELTDAQSVTVALSVKPIKINCGKFVSNIEAPLQKLVNKQALGEQVEMNCVKNVQYTILKMIADYYNAKICYPISRTKIFIEGIPVQYAKSYLIYQDVSRRDVIKKGRELGLEDKWFTGERNICKKLGIPWDLVDNYLNGSADVPINAVNAIMNAHENLS